MKKRSIILGVLAIIVGVSLSGCREANPPEPMNSQATLAHPTLSQIGPGTDPYIIHVIKDEITTKAEFTEGCAVSILLPRQVGVVPVTVTAYQIGIIAPAPTNAYTLVPATRPTGLPAANHRTDEYHVRVTRTEAAGVDEYYVLRLEFRRGNAIMGEERIVFHFKSS